MKKLFITLATLLFAAPSWAACIPSGVTDQYVYFVAVDSTDFTTRETGLTTFTVYRSRNGAAATAMTTPTVNETDTTNMPGVYELLLDEDMTIGAGNDVEEMVFHITQASMAPVTRSIELCRPKITAGNTLDVTSTGEAGLDFSNTAGTIDAAEIGTDAITATKIAASAIGASEIATDAIGAAEIATAAITNAEVSFDGSELTAIPWNAAWDAEVESEANDALVANHVDHLFAADYDPATPPGVSTAWANEMVESDAGVTRFTVNALENGPSGSGASAASIADAVWDEAQADHVTAGSFGVIASEIASTLVDTAEIGTAGAGLTAVPWNAAWDTEVESEANDALVANHVDHLFAADYDPATPPGVSTAWANEMVESDAGVTRFTANALEQGPSGGGSGGMTPVFSGTAQGGTATTIQLASAETMGDDIPNFDVTVCITGGTGAGQCRLIEDYVGSTDTATVSRAWQTNPSSDSTYEAWPATAHVTAWYLDATSVEAGLEDSTDIWAAASRTLTELDEDNTTIDLNASAVGDVTNTVSADVVSVSGDIVAANNAESFFDGTGYAGTNNVIPTVTTLTGHTAQTGDTFAQLPSNFNSLVISGAGSVDTLVQGFLNNTIAETTADNISGNFETFWDNGNAATTNTVDDVGAGAGGSFWSTGEQQEIRGRLGITGTTAAGGNTPTLALEATVAALNDLSQADVRTAVGLASANLDTQLGDVPTVSEFNARTLASTSYFDSTTDTVDVGAISGDIVAANNAESFFDGTGYAGTNNVIPNVTLVDTTTTNTDMRGTDSAATAAALSIVDGNVDEILIDTNATLDAIVDSILTDTDVTLPAAIAAVQAVLDNIANGTTELNVGEINGCEITGDGNATPFDSGC